MMTNHIVEMYKIQCSAEWWNGLSDKQREILTTSMDKAFAYGNEVVASTQAEYRSTMEAAGVEFVNVDSTLFRDKAKATIDELGSSYFKAGLLDRVRAIK
jgi:TRAP-type C4-dicarboxylate transport system substrate-binding protein